MDVLIIGGGIGGLTLALELARYDIPCRVYEHSQDCNFDGTGINLLPHAVASLSRLGLLNDLMGAGLQTRELRFYNRHAQLIHAQPRGRYAGEAFPQISIHRGALYRILYDAACEAIGRERIHMQHRCVAIDQNDVSVTAQFIDPTTGTALSPAQGMIAVGCDGIHSMLRKRLLPGEGPPLYAGATLWRGVAYAKPFLGGASMALMGSLRTGKMVVYPISPPGADDDYQLINWVAEMKTPESSPWDWTETANRRKFAKAFEDWSFDWINIPKLIADTETILEYPLIDRDPLMRWSYGRITLLGDAAHPMYPFGSNGAGQAILDARALTESLAVNHDIEKALLGYDARRVEPARALVSYTRTSSPDSLLEEVDRRCGGAPFTDINAIMSDDEINRIVNQPAALHFDRVAA